MTVNLTAPPPEPDRIPPAVGGPIMVDEPDIDARNAVGVQIGAGNTQIVYQYGALTWGDGVASPPLTTVTGRVDSPYRGLAA